MFESALLPVFPLKSVFRSTLAVVASAMAAAFFFAADAASQTPKQALPDLTRRPTLYVVGYAHLDTEWRWEYPQVIREFLPKTMHLNFDFFEKYPHYVFNFSGANRYRMMKEYYPIDYAKLKRYVAAGRWFPAGSSMEENDVNSPSAEAILRNFLYGNEYFRREFGKTSAEFMLPDCFGFPATLPSLLAHAGIKGFSTQKLTWGSSAPVGGPGSLEKTPVGIPFNVGYWEGPDGRRVLAALNPISYDSRIDYDISKSSARPLGDNYIDWVKRAELNGKATGLFADYRYYGTGDIGGAPDEASLKLLEAIITKSRTVLPGPRTNSGPGTQTNLKPEEIRVGDGPLRIISSNADQMFLDVLKSGRTSRLPIYKGDLELTNHSAGSLTSQAAHKQWSHENERLADAAERSAVAAAWLGGPAYPIDRLNNAWTLVLGGDFHDIMAGTATPKSYEFSWNDDVIALNQFADVLTSSTGAVASGMDTQAKGTPIVVYNSLNIPREDVVEAAISFPNGAPQAVQVMGPDGKEVPAQLEGGGQGSAKVLFLAKVPSVGFAVYDIQPSSFSTSASELKVTESSLENARYRVRVDENGDVASIFDKTLNRELLSAPARLAIQTEKPYDWPAWNMDWADQQKPPRTYVQGPAKIRIVENGPVRVALEVERETEGSKFVQTIRLSDGDAGNRVEFSNAIDWKSKEAALKATFPLTAANPEATYNWGTATIRRGNNDPKKFEVASHHWFDLTDMNGEFGVTILSGPKTGSDKPSDNTLRLTLIYTPGLGGGNGKDYSDQVTQDWGHHKFVYGLAAHASDWREGQTDWHAYRLDHPLIAFESPAHPGVLGKEFSLLRVDSDDVRVMAVKKAENSDEVIVRVVEMRGGTAPHVSISFAGPITAAREVNGQEQPLGTATLSNGALVTSLTPYALRTFSVILAPSRAKLVAAHSWPVRLTYDLAAASDDGEKSMGGFDAAGQALPAEMLPNEFTHNGIHFHLAPAWTGKRNAVVARGQTIDLPAGKFNRIYILAASADGDQRATFRVGNEPAELTIEDWGGYIGQWDTRIWKQVEVFAPPEPAPNDKSAAAQEARRIRAQIKGHEMEMTSLCEGVKPGFIKPAPVAWFASHRHTADGGNEPYSYSYLFAYSIDRPDGATTLTLPDNDRVRILAITVADEPAQVRPAHALYDPLDRTRTDMSRWNAKTN